MRKIDTNELQKMKLEVLQIIDSICKKYSVKYFLAYGTLIGAVREHGFIPWDEDVDILMMREDYEKFNEVASTELDERFFLQNYKTDKDLVYPITRICINGTYRCEVGYEKCRFHKGTFIDIFALDTVPDDTVLREKIINQCATDIKRIKRKLISPSSKSATKLLVKHIQKICLYILPLSYLQNKCLKHMTQYKGTDSKYVANLVDIYSKLENIVIDKKVFDSAVYLDFEGMQLPCPVGYDAFLTQKYGNYMTPPKYEDRKLDTPSYYVD